MHAGVASRVAFRYAKAIVWLSKYGPKNPPMVGWAGLAFQ